MSASLANRLIAAAAATFLLSSPAVSRPTSVRALAAQELRLTTMAYRMSAANADACPKREIITGLVLHDISRYDRAHRPAVSRAFSVNSGFGVLGIVPGSVASEAGLRVDDEIIAVGASSVEDHAAESGPKSYDRMELFQALLQAASERGEAKLVVRRGTNLLRLSLRAQYGCGGNLALTNSASLNAWADGKHIVITTGMVGLSRNDDEIAFVVAHEMAHNILGHSAAGNRTRGIFGFSRVKQGEIEADSYAVRLMAKAGYKPAGGISFLENSRRRLWWNISLDHPGFAARIKIVAAAIEAANGSADQLASTTTQPVLTSAQSSLRIPLKAPAKRYAASTIDRTFFLSAVGAGQLKRAAKRCER